MTWPSTKACRRRSDPTDPHHKGRGVHFGGLLFIHFSSFIHFERYAKCDGALVPCWRGMRLVLRPLQDHDQFSLEALPQAGRLEPFHDPPAFSRIAVQGRFQGVLVERPREAVVALCQNLVLEHAVPLRIGRRQADGLRKDSLRPNRLRTGDRRRSPPAFSSVPCAAKRWRI